MKQVKDFDVKSVSDLITRARVLMSGSSGGSQEVAAVASRGLPTVMRRHDPTSEANGSRGGTQGFKGRCFRCGGPHMARDCKEPKPHITFYRFGKEGHKAYRCERGK